MSTTPISVSNIVAKEYFVLIDKHKYRCKLCEKIYVGEKTSNLGTHLKKCHLEVLNERFEKINEKKYKLKRLKKIQIYTKFVTLSGRPFKILQDPAFLESQEEDLLDLKKHNCGINLKDRSYADIKSYIAQTLEKVIDRIKFETKGRLVSCMLDTATKNHTSFLGIDIRYIFGGQIAERSIGMMPLEERHTAAYLAKKVLECAGKFEITHKQISSCVTDNASNVVAVVDNFDDENYIADNHNNDSFMHEHSINGENSNSYQYNIADAIEIERIAIEIADEEAIDAALEDPFNYNDLLKEIAGKLHHSSSNTSGVRCGSHTVQLVVRGAIKKSSFQHMVTICRRICLCLTNQVEVYEMLENNVYVILPRKSTDTRWDSDLRMVMQIFYYFLLASVLKYYDMLYDVLTIFFIHTFRCLI